MKGSKLLTVVPLAGYYFSIFENQSGLELAKFLIAPSATFMQNAELASAIMEAYERYIKDINKKYIP